ncbi:PREDICTED: uncharacterized protein LOC108367907 [Rhagoletis zephyria]|nr:PREDICTED: uncharacterized protein LOC108367907 [Rhagoletis zephyria]
MVTKMSFERNLAKRENRFFRAIIGKLQRSKNECFTIEKKEVYQQYAHEFDEKPVDCNKHYEMNYRDMLKARGDFQGEYLLKQKLCVNYSNTSAKYTKVEKCEHSEPESNAVVKRCYLHEGVNRHRCGSVGISSGDAGRTGVACKELVCSDHEPEFPIRYTINDESMFAGYGGGGCGGPCTSRSNSCTSLQANFSTSSIFCGGKETSPDGERECTQNNRPHQLTNVDGGVRFVYSKFGNFH